MPDSGTDGSAPAPPGPFSRTVFALLLWTTAAAGGLVLVASAVGMARAGGVAKPVALAALAALVVVRGAAARSITCRSYGEGITPSIAFTFAIMFLLGSLAGDRWPRGWRRSSPT